MPLSTVDWPRQNQQGYLVNRALGATTGTICVSGNSKDGLAVARHVFAKVFFPTIADPTLFAKPDPLTPWVRPDAGTGAWDFGIINPALPGARCGTGGVGNENDNTLIVWVDWGSDPYELVPRNFTGACSDHTLCGSGSGSGSGFSFASVSYRPEEQAPEVQQWSVQVAGFAGKRTNVLNKVWNLRLRPSDGNLRFWENRAEGKKGPRVELSCERPVAYQWRLILTHGTLKITYVLPVCPDWRREPLRFTQLEGALPPKVTGPKAIEVMPL